LVITSVSQRCKGHERTFSISHETGAQLFRQGDLLNELSAKISLVVTIAAVVLVVALIVVLVLFVIVPVVRRPGPTQGCRANDDDDDDEYQ
jgi:hypothetical protein